MPLLLFNKPCRVLCQFSREGDKRVLADYISIPGVYPAGRLDFDSEGLLVLTDDGLLQARIAAPANGHQKHYWVQVEGEPAPQQLAALRDGVKLKDGPATALSVSVTEEPSGLWPRDPPIRYRASVPTAWLDLSVGEGRNRLVRRMTAAVGLPTLRLVRHRVGPWSLRELRPGEITVLDNRAAWRHLGS